MSVKMFNAEAAATEVAAALVSTHAANGASFVTTPVTYPSGAHAIVRLEGTGDLWFVSDDGNGSLEADLMNASLTYRRIAPLVAKRAGLGFDQQALFIVEATREELPGAVVAIANASAEAVRRTAIRVEELRYGASRALFDQRVQSTFRGQTIIRKPEIKGASGRTWEFSAGVEHHGNIIYLLDLVRPRPQAAYATISKFTDLEPDASRKGAAILTDIDRMDPHLIRLLSRVAGTAIPANAPLEEWHRKFPA